MLAYDGTLKFDTAIDTKGFASAVGKLGAMVGKSLLAAGAAIVSLGTAAVKTGAEFDSAMSNVKAISGASQEEFDRLREKALEMAAGTKFSTKEAADALSYMGMAGWDAEQMISGLPGIMNLAAASGADLATTSDIVTDALTALNMEASESAHFADILAAASANSNTNVELMGETFKYCAAMAGSLHYEAEDLAVAIGLMANAGIKGSMAGTSLNMMLTRLSTNVNGAEDACKSLGFAFYDETDAARPLIDVLNDMRKATADMTDKEKADFAQTVAGSSAKKGLLAILNASEEEYNKLSEAISTCTDEEIGFSAAAAMAEEQLNNLTGEITLMQGELSVLGVLISDELKSPLKDTVSFARELVSELTNAVQSDGLNGLVSAVGDVFAKVVTKIADATPQIIAIAAELIHSFCEGLKNADGIASAGADVILSLASGIASAGIDLVSVAGKLSLDIAQEFIGRLPEFLSIGTNLIGSLIQGATTAIPQIAQLGIKLFQALTDSITESLPGVIPVAMNAILEFTRSLRENFGLLVDAGLGMIVALAGALIDALPVFIETIPEIVTNICGLINDNAPKLIIVGMELILQLAKGLIKAIPTLVKSIPEIIKAIFAVFSAVNWISLGKTVINGIAKGIKSLASKIPQSLKNIGKTAKEAISSINWKTLGSDIINHIGNGMKSVANMIPQIFKSIADKIPQILKSIVDAMTNIVGQLPNLIWKYLSNVLTYVIQWGTSLYEKMSAAVSSAITAVSDWFAQLPGKLSTWLTDTINKVIAWGTNLLSTASNAASNTVSIVGNWFSELPGKIQSHLTTAINDVIQWGSNLAAKGKEAAEGLVSTVYNKINELPDRIVAVGTRLVQGIWNGISGAYGWITGKIRGWVGDIENYFKSMFGIASPSKLMRDEIGRWLPPGIGEGWEEAMPDLLDQMDSDVEAMANRMKAEVEAETSGITVKQKAAGEHNASIETPPPGNTYVEEKFEQYNEYNVPVATPSEVSKSQREAARKLLGGVK